jgi:hypothetical protein
VLVFRRSLILRLPSAPKRTSNISETAKSVDKTSQVLGSAGIEPATNRL